MSVDEIEILEPAPTEVFVGTTPDDFTEVGGGDLWVEILQPPAVYIELLADLAVEEIEIITGIPIFISGGSSSQVIGETPAGAIDGSNKAYTTSQSFVPSSLAAYVNGLRMRIGPDLTVTGNSSFRMVEALLTGDSIIVDYIQQ